MLDIVSGNRGCLLDCACVVISCSMAYLEVIVVAVSSLFVLLTGALAEQTTCQVVPPCSCSMSDGSGLIDLHRLQMST